MFLRYRVNIVITCVGNLPIVAIVPVVVIAAIVITTTISIMLWTLARKGTA